MTTLAELDAKVERLRKEHKEAKEAQQAARRSHDESWERYSAISQRAFDIGAEIERAVNAVQELETAIARGRVTG